MSPGIGRMNNLNMESWYIYVYEMSRVEYFNELISPNVTPKLIIISAIERLPRLPKQSVMNLSGEFGRNSNYLIWGFNEAIPVIIDMTTDLLSKRSMILSVLLVILLLLVLCYYYVCVSYSSS